MMTRDRRSREDRRKAIQGEAESSRREGGDFAGPGYLIGEAELAKLGVRQYVVDSGDKPEEGRTHVWSFLEPHPSDPCVVGLGLYIHYGVGAEEETVLCPRFMKKEWERMQASCPDADFPMPDVIKSGQCPICEARDKYITEYKARKDSMSEDDRKAWHKKHIRDLEPFNGGFTDPKPNRYLSWIVDEADGGKRLDDGVQLVLMATGGKNNSGVHKGLMDQAVDRVSGEVIDVLDPSAEGFKFSFFRQGKGTSNISYSGHRLRPRREALDQEWLDTVPRFADVLKFWTYDQIKSAYYGVKTDESSKRDDDADDAPDERTTARRAERSKVGDELAEHFEESADEGTSRQRRRREAEPDLTEGPARGADTSTREDRRTAAEGPARRRRQDDDDDRPPAKQADPDEPSPEALALAERVRNRARRREGGDK